MQLICVTPFLKSPFVWFIYSTNKSPFQEVYFKGKAAIVNWW